MSKRKTHKYWTITEIEYLRNAYSHIKVEEIAENLDRTKISVIKKAEREGLKGRNKNFTEEEKEYVRKNYKNMSNRMLGFNLRKSEGSIEYIKATMGLKKSKKWSGDEIELLRDCYSMFSNVEIGKVLGRSRQAVTAMGMRLGLKKGKVVMGMKKNYLDFRRT